jgi:hypothetical protein
VHRQVDVRLLAQRLVPRGRRGGPAVPSTPGQALDGLQRDVALGADGGQRLERLGIARVLHLHVVVRREHGVEGKPFQAAAVHLGHRQAMAGDADEAHQPLLARLDRRLEGAIGAQRGVPLDDVDQVVQLDGVDPVDAEAVEGPPDLLPGAAVGPFPRLRRDEEGARVALQPRRDPQFGVAVARRHVDVVDAVLQELVQGPVGVALGHAGQRRGTEDHAAGVMAGRAERRPWEHDGSLGRSVFRK